MVPPDGTKDIAKTLWGMGAFDLDLVSEIIMFKEL